MNFKNYKTYKEIPEAIACQEDFEGNSVQGLNKKDWYYVYSYRTIMAIVLANGAGVVLNTHKYSPTTSKLQNILRRVFAGEHVFCVDPGVNSEYRDNCIMQEKAENIAISDY